MFAPFDGFDDRYDKGNLRERTEGAVFDALTAMNTLLIVDGYDTVLIGTDGVDRTALFAGTLMVADGIVRAGLSTFAAFLTFIRINVCLAASDGNRTEFAGIQAVFAETFLAVVCNDEALDWTFGAGTVKKSDPFYA